MKKLVIEVTANDIARGEPRKSTACAMALAMQRRLGADIIVTGLRVYRELVFDHSVIFQMTKKAGDFVRKFDKGEPVEPTSFTFLVPESVIT